MSYRLGIIGGGNMGGAIVRGCIRGGVLHAGEIIVAEPDGRRRAAIAESGCAVAERAAATLDATQVMLAVKPQVFPQVAQEIREGLAAERIVISIMAGLSSDRLREALGDRGRIIRAMPNTPCQVGAGMTAVALGEGAHTGDEALAMSIFNALGRTVMVDEPLMYAVTAVSGSGPAYVFLLAEAMEQAALHFGIDGPAARTLVGQTILGAGRMLVESGEPANALREAVTSPGGTTAAALEVFDNLRFAEIVKAALTAARDRGAALDRHP